MTAPRGKVRELVIALGEIQDLIGKASSIANNDRNPNRQRDLNDVLGRAFDRCVEARSIYDPVDTDTREGGNV